MKINVIKVTIIMALGLVMPNQTQAQHVESTVRDYRISVETDNSRGEGIQFYVRSQQLAYFFPRENVFLTKTYFQGETILQKTTAFNGVADFSVEIRFNRNVRETRIEFGITSVIPVHVNGNIRKDNGKSISKETLVLQSDVCRARYPDNKIVFNNDKNEEKTQFLRENMCLHQTSNEQGGFI